MSLFASTAKCISRINTLAITRSYTATPALQRYGGGRDRDSKIKITLEQLRMARRGRGRGVPICHEQQEKIMNALEAANYEVCLYDYILMHGSICDQSDSQIIVNSYLFV